MRARLVDVLGDLDAAGLAATTDQDLGLDHAGVADPVRGGDGVLDVGAGSPSGRRRRRGEQLLALVFE